MRTNGAFGTCILRRFWIVMYLPRSRRDCLSDAEKLSVQAVKKISLTAGEPGGIMKLDKFLSPIYGRQSEKRTTEANG